MRWTYVAEQCLRLGATSSVESVCSIRHLHTMGTAYTNVIISNSRSF